MADLMDRDDFRSYSPFSHKAVMQISFTASFDAVDAIDAIDVIDVIDEFSLLIMFIVYCIMPLVFDVINTIVCCLLYLLNVILRIFKMEDCII